MKKQKLKQIKSNDTEKVSQPFKENNESIVGCLKRIAATLESIDTTLELMWRDAR